MDKTRIETIVGIFVLAGILCLAFLSIKLGKMEFFGGEFYRVSADFESVSGLKSGASVEIAGVEVGRVERIDSHLFGGFGHELHGPDRAARGNRV